MWSVSLVISGHGQGHEQFLHCYLWKFCYGKSSVYRWYTQLDCRRFVYDTYKTMKATRMHHGWVHMFSTHQPTLALHFITYLFRTCCTRVSALLRGNWQDFNWHDASRGLSAIAELLVVNGGRTHWRKVKKGHWAIKVENHQFETLKHRDCTGFAWVKWVSLQVYYLNISFLFILVKCNIIQGYWHFYVVF